METVDGRHGSVVRIVEMSTPPEVVRRAMDEPVYVSLSINRND